MIANTCGWDTDCNSGNVGCLLGIRGGLQALDAVPADGDGNGVGKWRGPVADRLYLPTADGGRCITDAVQQSYRLINLGRGLQGLDPLQPKQGARYHFSLPGSVQGFEPSGAATSAANDGGRLAVQFAGVDATQRRRHFDRHLHTHGRRQGGRLPASGLADPALGAAHPRAGGPGRSGNRRRGLPAVGEGGARRG